MNVLSIQSAVAYGHVGNSAAAFALARLGHEVWTVDTVTFSNHPAHGGFRGRVVPAAEVRELVEGVAERGALDRCDAVLSGYLGEAGTAEVVREAVARVRVRQPAALYCCDPVLGEVGRGFYVRPGIPELVRRRLVPAADLVTPNPFELEYLSGRSPDSLEAALAAAETVRGLGPDLVVATGLRLPGAPETVAVLAACAAGAWLARAPHRELPTHGAGDLFAAVFLGAFLLGRDPAAALGHAMAALDAVLAVTQVAGADELCLVAAQEALVHPPRACAVERLR